MAKKPDAEVGLRRSSGGVFEVTVDGVLRSSKRLTGRFSIEADVIALIS